MAKTNYLQNIIGWGITTLLLSLFNKSSNVTSESEPNDLSVTSSETKLGSPIPVVLGRALVKSPIVSYFGDFSARAYTEEYSAHGNFNAWPLVISLIVQYIGMLWTGHTAPTKTAPTKLTDPSVSTSEGGGQVNDPTVEPADVPTTQTKDDYIGPLLQALFIWLLSWLINGRNLKTTIQKGFKYYLGYQFLISWSGPEMRIRRVYMNEVECWSGDVSRRSLGDGAMFNINVNDDEMFGGPDENGGFIGDLHTYLGGDNQGVDGWMVAQMSADTVQAELRGLTPAYQPFVTMVIPTAYIGKQSKIPTTWIELQNCPNNLGLGQIGEDANPAEVIYEIITNKDWGLAESADNLDIEALRRLGNTVRDEGLGISVQLTSITSAEQIIKTICDHIGAVHYVDPHTGKMVFKLIRNDYDETACPEVNTGNCSKLTFTRLDWSQIISKISVSYTDADNRYETGTVPTQDPAAIEINSGIQTVKTYDYSMFTKPENALWAAKRELHSQAYPLAAVNMTVNRQLFDVRIGDVIILTWKPYGIKRLFVRVTNVDIASFEEGQITIDGIEDVFSLGKDEYGASSGTLWVKEELHPVGVNEWTFLEAPYEFFRDRNTNVLALAEDPSGTNWQWAVWRSGMTRAFVMTASLSLWPPTGHLVFTLREDDNVEDSTGIEISGTQYLDRISLIGTERGGKNLMLIGDEIISFGTLYKLPNGNWQAGNIIRGVFDTVPQNHFSLDTIYFLVSGRYMLTTGSGIVCSEGETVTEQYNITTERDGIWEDFNFSKVREFTTQRRAERPIPPGRIRFNDFARRDIYFNNEFCGDITIDYAERNNSLSTGAVSQDDTLVFGTSVAITAPTGTDYVLNVSNGRQEHDYTYTSGITLDWSTFCSDFTDITLTVTFKLYSRYSGLKSYMPQQRTFTWYIPTFLGVFGTTAELNSYVTAYGIADRFVIPASSVCSSFSVLYERMPFFIEEDPTGAGTPILCYDGSMRSTTNRIIAFDNLGSQVPMTMGTDFSFYSNYDLSGGRTLYKWDGTALVVR